MTNSEQETDRETWVRLYRDGYKLGCSERTRSTQNRREDVTEVIEDDVSEFELTAKQAGYDLGRKGGFPGANIDVGEEVNTAFDRSRYSAGLGDFA